MRDALTIVVVHVSRQQGQSLLHVGQEFSLKAGADFFQLTAAPPSSAYRRRDYAAAHRLFLPLVEAGDDDTGTNCSDASKAKACSETLLSALRWFRRGCDPGGHPSPIQQGAAGAA
jgi:hypothetical protein